METARMTLCKAQKIYLKDLTTLVRTCVDQLSVHSSSSVQVRPLFDGPNTLRPLELYICTVHVYQDGSYVSD